MSEGSSSLKRIRSEDAETSDGDKGILLTSDIDGGCVRFSERAAAQSEMLLAGLEMELERATFSAPVPTATLELIARLLARDEAEYEAEVTKLSEGDDVHALCRGSLFLGARSLQLAACRRVAALFEGLETPSRIRAALSIAADLTPEEERAALDEPIFAAPRAESAASLAEASAGLDESPPPVSRSFSTRLAGGDASSAEDIASAVLDHCTPAALWKLKGVSRAWQARARDALTGSTWRCELSDKADSLMGLLVDLDFALQHGCERWDIVADLALAAPETAQLRAKGFVVDMDALGECRTIDPHSLFLFTQRAAETEQQCEDGCSLDDDGRCLFCGYCEPSWDGHPLPWASICFALARGLAVVVDCSPHALRLPASRNYELAEALGRCAARCPELRRAYFGGGSDIPTYLLRPPFAASAVEAHHHATIFSALDLLFSAHVVVGAAEGGTAVDTPPSMPFELVLSRQEHRIREMGFGLHRPEAGYADGACWARVVAVLAPALRPAAMPSLVRLDLSGACLGTSGGGALAAVLKSGALPNLFFLILEECLLGDLGASHVADAIAAGALRRCTQLNLADNCIGDDGLCAIVAAAEPGNTLARLTELTVGAFPIKAWRQNVRDATELVPTEPFEGRNTFGDAALEALATGALPCLRRLNLGDSQPSATALRALVVAAEERGFVVYGQSISAIFWIDSQGQKVAMRPELPRIIPPTAGHAVALLAGDEASYNASPVDWTILPHQRTGCPRWRSLIDEICAGVPPVPER